MAELFQFGGKQNLHHRDKLEHYRLEIKKLKEINYILEQRYEKKIQTLENQLKMGNKPSQTYQPTGKINNQIIKRDQEINRLTEENSRLRRQIKQNPDRHLIPKKRQMFDLVADKQQEIMSLKKTIHELQSRYDGKYFNESKFKQQYQMLIKQNEALKREVINLQAKQQKKTEINKDILDGIRYKKEYELMRQENQVLRSELMKVSKGEKVFVNKTLGENTHNQLLRSEVERNNTVSGELLTEMKKIKSENQQLRQQNESLRKTLNLNKELENGSSSSKVSKRRIFVYDRQSVSDSKASSSVQNDLIDPQQQSRMRGTVTKKGLYDQFQLGKVRESSTNVYRQ